MNDLIKVTKVNHVDVVSARELHAFLEVNTRFDMWIIRMFEYGFEEETDFCTILGESTGGRPSTDYALKIRTAKEISMLQRTDKGKQARQYFLDVEEKANTPLNALDVMQIAINQLRAQETRFKNIEQRVKYIEARKKTTSDYFTIVGYATLNNISCGLKLAANLGRKASALCKSSGIKTESLPDPRFGIVKTYPIHILKEVFNT